MRCLNAWSNLTCFPSSLSFVCCCTFFELFFGIHTTQHHKDKRFQLKSFHDGFVNVTKTCFKSKKALSNTNIGWWLKRTSVSITNNNGNAGNYRRVFLIEISNCWRANLSPGFKVFDIKYSPDFARVCRNCAMVHLMRNPQNTVRFPMLSPRLSHWMCASKLVCWHPFSVDSKGGICS